MGHHVITIVGLFVIACLAAARFYGLYPIITCIIGLFVFAALLRLFCGDA